MVKYQDDCVQCGQPCLGSACEYHNAPHYYCDECGDECSEDDMYAFEDQELCADCLLSKTKIIRWR